VSGCYTGIYGGTGYTVSGVVSGCYTGLNVGAGHTVSGVVSGCYTGIYGGIGHKITGYLSYTAAGVPWPNTIDIRINSSTDGPLNVVSRGAKIPIPPIFYERNVAGDGRRGLVCEDYNQTVGSSYAFYCTGDVKSNVATLRTGGAASSIECVPSSACASDGPLPLFEWTEFAVAAAEQTRKIYILGNGWGTYPTNAQLYFEAEWLSGASGTAKTITASTAVLTNNTTWTEFSIAFQPLQVGPVRYRGWLKKYDSGGTAKIFIDNKLYTS
jgi:hypothetical protein